jgi:hypothetical protein
VIPDASVRAIKRLAVDAAVEAGWNVSSDGAGATFEIQLDEPATPRPADMPASAHTWLRIRLSFSAEASDVVVVAHAEEIWMDGLAVRYVVDLDRAYRGNLIDMLGDLRDRFR